MRAIDLPNAIQPSTLSKQTGYLTAVGPAPPESLVPQSKSSATEADRLARERASTLLGLELSGRYRLLDLVALGGVGAVYLGEHLLLRKHVAIKVLHADSQRVPDLLARFHREAVAGAHIQHPNVAAATDFGETELGLRYLVLEYICGETLRAIVDRGPVPVARAVSIARQIAAGLGAAHRKGILHRDIKPRNVMVVEGTPDIVKLIDFGLAKVDMQNISDVAVQRASSEDDITDVGVIFGTIAYLAPEAASGMERVDARADLYSLGVVLYEMLAGSPIFDTKNPLEAFQHHQSTKPLPIATRTPGVRVPAPLEAVVMRLLEKKPEARYATSDAVIEALDLALVGSALREAAMPAMTTRSPATGANSLTVPSPAAEPHQAVSPAPSTATEMPSPSATTISSNASRAALSAAPKAPKRSASRAVAVALGAVLSAAGLAAIGLQVGRAVREKATAEAPTAGEIATSPPATAEAAAEAQAPLPNAPPSTPTAPMSSIPPRAPSSESALAARLILRTAVARRDWVRAVQAFLKLVETSPASFRDARVVSDTRDLATAIALGAGDGSDPVFDALATRLGADGLDILYEILRARGGTKAAARAEALLRQPRILANATPTMRISFEFRAASCEEKASLLDRAVAEGDSRTLTALEVTGASCLGNTPELRRAIKNLRAKLQP